MIKGILSVFVIISHTVIVAKAHSSTEIDPLFGPEFTFSNCALDASATVYGGPCIVNSPANERAQLIWLQLMKERCGVVDCLIEKKLDRYGLPAYTFRYPNGISYTLSMDPAVIEIQMRPMTLPQVIRFESFIQTEIFDIAKQIGLTPQKNFGSGHVHMDLRSSFGDDPKLFIDFIVDFANHYNLSTDCMGNTGYSAPPLIALPEENRREFAKIVGHAHANPSQSIEEITAQIRNLVYSATTGYHCSPQKHQAINLERVSEELESDRTIEIRGIRAQKNVQDYIRILRILKARLNYLKQRRLDGFGFVPWNSEPTEIAGKLGFDDMDQNAVHTQNRHSQKRKPTHWLSSGMTAFLQFYNYVVEAGLPWEEFRTLLPENLLRYEDPFEFDDFCPSTQSSFPTLQDLELKWAVFSRYLTYPFRR